MPQGRNRRARYTQDARAAASEFGIPPRLFLSMIDHESAWNPVAVSSAGAIGLGQLMPGTARGLGVDPWNPRDNLRGAAKYLSSQQQRFGNWRDALRAYNQGPNAIEDPDAGAEYASSILAGRSRYRKVRGPVRSPLVRAPRAPGGAPDLGQLAQMLFADEPDFLPFAMAVADKLGGVGPVNPYDPHDVPMTTRAKVTKVSYDGKLLIPSTDWRGNHVTDGLDWNNGKQTAVDIMAHAGTPVGAPESGTIVKHGSAQGGEALYFLSDSGHLYWMGHIDGRLPVGTHVNRGQPLAVISSDHPAPHLHIDRYRGNNPGRYYR